MLTGGAISLVALTKDYAGVPAVRGINIDIKAGEFFSLLGPSGCGKTSTLRMIAGFEEPSSGEVLLDGADIVNVPAHQRPVNTVFQDYALFPFMDVASNVAFGLKYQKLNKTETEAKVNEALAMVRMTPYASRRPAQLSGGQRQRVALARALVLGPRVLLLDEPLGALDAKLRKDLQVELKALQERVGITFVYVTHDQEEALTMSDRLAVMAGGLVEQVGTPREVYEQPATAYVADFLGSANVLDVVPEPPDSDGVPRFRLGGRVFRAPGSPVDANATKLVVRPERLRLTDPIEAPDVVVGEVERVLYLGATVDVAVRIDAQHRLAVEHDSEARSYSAGERVGIAMPEGAVRLLPPGATPGA